MAALEEVLHSLKLSNKGKLRYDRHWMKDGDFEQVLQECTTPPTITSLSTSRTYSAHKCSPTTGVSSTPFKGDRSVHASLSFSEITDGDTSEPSSTKGTDRSEFRTNEDQAKSPNKLTKNAKNVRNQGEKASPEEKKEKLIVSPQAAISEVELRDYEDAWNKEVEVAKERRRRMFEQHSDQLEKQAEHWGLELLLEQERESRKLLHHEQQKQHLRTEEVKKKQQKLREDHIQHKKMLETKMKEAEARKRRIEEEAKKREEENRQRLSAMSKLLQDARLEQAKVSDILSGCPHQKYLGDLPNKCRAIIDQLTAKMDQMTTVAMQNGVDDAQVKMMGELHAKVKNTIQLLRNTTEQANKKGKEEEEKKKAEAAAAAAATAATAAAVTAAATTTAPAATATTQAPSVAAGGTSNQGQAASSSAVTAKSDEMLCVTEEAFKEYTKLQEQKQHVAKIYEPMMANTALKKYRFDLKKAVNTPVNAISAQSGSHLRDKLQRILNILGGNPVDVGGRRVSAGENVAGVAYVKDLFAEKIVDQGSQQVSSNHESAFAIAAVAVAVWYDHADVGQLMLAHFHTKCPYTLPYYLPILAGQSEEEYYRSLGYTYDGGSVEQQDKFLRRMSGLMRLYAAILISMPPRGQQQVHPYGIDHAWIWLTRVLNLEPRPDITATMLYDFLQVTGNMLWKTYGKQFLKLLRILCSDYMPKIHGVTLQGSGGPVTRLETYLQKCINSGQIRPPEGLLPSHFWNSR